MIEIPASIKNALDRLSLQNSVTDSIIIDKLEKKLPSIFNVVVLSGTREHTNNKNLGTAYGNDAINNPQEDSYYFVRVRRVDIDENFLADPFTEKSAQKTKQIINMHPIGVVRKMGTSRPPQDGDIYSCRYLTKDRKGILLMNRIGVSKKFLSLKDKESLFQSSAATWAGETLADYSPNQNFSGVDDMPTVPTQVSNGVASSTTLDFTWDQLIELHRLRIFEPLQREVARYEVAPWLAAKSFNGNQFDGFNYGANGGTIGKTSMLPKPLTQYTIAEIRYMQENRMSFLNNKEIFACGAYQITPVLQGAIKKVAGLNTAFLFNEENQGALFIYLTTRKSGRTTLGGYMFGMNDKANTACNQLAMEFAPMRVITSVVRGDGVRIPQYSRYYGGVGVNKSGGINKAQTLETMRTINLVRQNIDNSPRALELRDLVMSE